LADRFRRVARDALGADALVETKPSMASEDFVAWSLPDHSVRIFCFWLGASDPSKVLESERTGIALPATHSPQFAPVAAPAIRTGVIAMTALATSLMNEATNSRIRAQFAAQRPVGPPSAKDKPQLTVCIDSPGIGQKAGFGDPEMYAEKRPFRSETNGALSQIAISICACTFVASLA
jgi:hypothetical protein